MNYDQSCTVDPDCVEVYVGNACTDDIVCRAIPATINVRALPRYMADVANWTVPGGNCPPPVDAVPGCVGGICRFTSCPKVVPDGTDCPPFNGPPPADAGANVAARLASDASAE